MCIQNMHILQCKCFLKISRKNNSSKLNTTISTKILIYTGTKEGKRGFYDQCFTAEIMEKK